MQICILRIGQRPPNRWKNARPDRHRQSVKNVMHGGDLVASSRNVRPQARLRVKPARLEYVLQRDRERRIAAGFVVLTENFRDMLNAAHVADVAKKSRSVRFDQCPLWPTLRTSSGISPDPRSADTVAKALFHWGSKILRAKDATFM
jgi:hypothetical protein